MQKGIRMEKRKVFRGMDEADRLRRKATNQGLLARQNGQVGQLGVGNRDHDVIP